MTAADPMERAENVLASVRTMLPEGPVHITEPLPYEQVPHLRGNVSPGAYIVPLLQPNTFSCEAAAVTFRCTKEQLSRLHDGDVVLATRLGNTDTPVHSLGAITAVEDGETHVVTVEVALTRYDDTAAIVGYEVFVAR